MDQESQVIEQTVAFVKRTLHESSHDWLHIERVWKTAVDIGVKEGGVDLFVIHLTALLHDIADWKFHDGDVNVGPRVAREWLEKMKVPSEVIDHVCGIIRDMSFIPGKENPPLTSKEGMIVQDADRLDALGAIGIARAFTYGGYRGQSIYHPDGLDANEGSGSTVGHFYEKLLLLKDRMNTATGKQLASERHDFMVEFLQRLKAECEVKYDTVLMEHRG